MDDAFALSQSYGLRLEWDPFVKSQRLLNDAAVAGKASANSHDLAAWPSNDLGIPDLPASGGRGHEDD
jgi:hypothetical protein